MAVYVTGWEKFIEVGQRLEHVSIAEPIRRAITDVGRNLEGDIKRSAEAILPHAGHLGSEIARTTSITSVPSEEGVRIVGDSPHNIELIDEGSVFHPLFGNKAHWYEERVNPGWWSTPTKASEPRFQEAVERAMEEIKQEIEGG